LKITTAKYFTPSGRSIQKINYSERNKVFESNKKNDEREFRTDLNRKVFSAGGIKPDSFIVNRSKSTLVQRLLADGMFFGFATYFYNDRTNMDFNKLSAEQLLKEFQSYIKKQKFEFTSPAEKLIEQLKTAAVQENLNGAFLELLEKSKSQIDESHSREMEKYREDIIASIKEELAARTDGRIGRIVESLKSDAQFKTAMNILANSNIYNGFLKKSL